VLGGPPGQGISWQPPANSRKKTSADIGDKSSPLEISIVHPNNLEDDTTNLFNIDIECIRITDRDGHRIQENCKISSASERAFRFVTIGIDSGSRWMVAESRLRKSPLGLRRAAQPAHHRWVGGLCWLSRKTFIANQSRVPVPAEKYLSKSRCVKVGILSLDTSVPV
jgi:hypothetical protein